MSDVLRLFLIEDNDDIALLIRKSLERVDHSVTRCRTAADALIVLAQTTFDLVLLDQRLPDMSGLELLQKLAREGIVAPVLMVTAYGDEHLAIRVLRAGALDYIVKDPALTFLGELPKRVAESVHRHRLEQDKQMLIQALESARDGIMITDLQGTILKVNQALENLTGYSRGELVGQNPRLLKSGVHPADFYAQMWQTIMARGSWQGELTNRRKDGQFRQTSMTISPIVDTQGRLTHFVGIQRDITEHKQLERQLLQAQKMQSVGTLAGGIAHEFNNLLAGINGYAALGLREPDLSPTLREFLQNVVDLSERAATLTRQLLAFARKPALVRTRVVLLDLLRASAALVARTLHLEVVLDIAPAEQMPPPLVEADANQLQQALVNLALNARDAVLARKAGAGQAWCAQQDDCGAASSPDAPGPAPGADEDKIVFRLRYALLNAEQAGFPQRVPPGEYFVVEVEDHGLGMTADVLNQSLDPFFTTKEVGQGTGLGLPVVFGIVQGHHGYLTLDSEPARGTCVALYLPRLVERDSQRRSAVPVQLGEAEVVEPEVTPRRAILVVDDEEAVLDVVRRFLQIAGHEVTCLTSGREAIEMLAEGKLVDLVILDVMMPREDSAQTFQRIRQRCPSVPILLCTGLHESTPATQLLRQPGTTLLRKPFRMNELWYAVKEALGGTRGGVG
jgi:PAS domain S-box-containing protein